MNERIIIDTPDGSFGAYVARPSATPAPCIVVIQEIFGINADMRAHCDELADKGYIAVCPDMFWRLEPGVELSDKSEAEWARAMALLKRFDIDSGVADLGATIDAARKLDGASGKIGVMGFCMGGLLTFLTAARVGADAAAAYYGGRTDQFVAEFKNLKTPLVMHLAQDDEYIPKAAQDAISAAAEELEHVQVFVYPGQNHAFARVDGIHFNAEAAQLANQRTERFFAKHLR
jgi:carboxymethylenebutenolidase